MNGSHRWLGVAAMASSVLGTACGSRSALPLGDAVEGDTTTTTLTATCDLHLDPRPLPAFAPGALCIQGGGGALSGPTMAYVHAQWLYGLAPSASSEQYMFFEYGPQSTYESARAVASRGEWVFAGDALTSPSESKGKLVLARRDGQIVAEKALSSGPGSFVQLTLTGSASGLMVYSYEAYPAAHTLGAISPQGPLPVSMEGVDPLTDPDDAGMVAVREYDTADRKTYWLSLCDGAARETLESSRILRSLPFAWGRFMVYLSDDGASLVVEGSDGAKSFDLTPPGDPIAPTILDFHPAGWALVTTKDPMRFVAVHAGTEEMHTIDITFPAGYQRYASYVEGPDPKTFDPNGRELRVTCTGGVILPLRSAALGYLFVSQDGSDWQSVGAPIGNVFGAKGIEAGGSYLHIGDAYSVTIPPWDAAPPGSGRLDAQSVQLIRPEDGKITVIINPPMGSYYNDIYRLSGDGGCLARRGVSSDDVEWTSAVTGEKISFPSAPQDSLLPTFDWPTDEDVESASLLSW